jgi:hypothetical protein
VLPTITKCRCFRSYNTHTHTHTHTHTLTHTVTNTHSNSHTRTHTRTAAKHLIFLTHTQMKNITAQSINNRQSLRNRPRKLRINDCTRGIKFETPTHKHKTQTTKIKTNGRHGVPSFRAGDGRCRGPCRYCCA